jgi:hypothetical protein
MKRGAAFLPVGILVVVFCASRLLYTTRSPGVGSFSLRGGFAAQAWAALSGEKLEVGTLERGMPLLDARLLREDLWRSLYYLHAQPPLFNLFVAGLLRAPDFPRTYQYANWSFALALYLTTYALMRRLGISAGVALLLTILFLLSPNAAWMESAVYYGLPLALALVLAAFCLDRAAQGRGLSWFAAYCALIAVLPLTRAFFTLPWCVTAAAFGAAVVWRRDSAGASSSARRRRILLMTCAPVLVAAAFQVKQILLFGQFTGSSWLGCNLTTMTAGMRAAKQAELARGNVSPLVNVYRNDSVEVYRRYFSVPPTGVPALDEARKSGGEPNFNNAIYLPVGRQYLKDSLYLIARYPHIYLANVGNSLYIFSGYQIGIYFDHPGAFFARWNWVELAAPLVGFPLIVWAVAKAIHGLRRDSGLSPDRRPTVAFLVANVIYVALVSCLIEKSEGPVYRFQVDAFLWTLLGLGLMTVLAKRRRPAPAS